MGFARSYRRYRRIIQHTGGISYDPRKLAQIYGFPPGFDGTGQTIAFIELGGGYVQADYDAYRIGLGLTPKLIKFVSVDGGTNSPSTPDSADGEVMLDLDVACAAPGAQPVVYMAPNTDKSFANAIIQAVKDKIDIISISWGAPEDQWDAQSMNAMTAALTAAQAAGITVTVAAGDNGSSDGETGVHVDFPSSSLHVLGCGGTTLTSTGSGLNEVVWNNGAGGGATGGGISTKFFAPPWQAKSNLPGGGKMRGVPDIAAVADPETGIMVQVDGQVMVIGGTSAVAPFWAALIACLNQALGKNVGFINDKLYALGSPASWGRDIVSGNNGTYVARTGYDCCTGLGVPIGTALLAALGGQQPPPGNGGMMTLGQSITFPKGTPYTVAN